MPGNERGRSEKSAPIQNDLTARCDQPKAITEVDQPEWLAEYPEWVREGVRRWNRMRADGVKWKIRPIVYPKPDAWGE